MANCKAVGRIMGSALNGLCERMCISVDCVIDACRNRRLSQTASVTLTDITPGAVPPFNFVAAVQSGDAEFIVNSSCPSGECRRVEGTLSVPVSVSFTDARGVCSRGRGVIAVPVDLMLRVPRSDTEPYRFVAEALIICTSGAFLSDSVVSLTYCIVETYKTVIKADILVPSYGFAVYPDCRNCDGCAALMNLGTSDENRT